MAVAASITRVLKILFKIVAYTLGGVIGLVVVVLIAVNFLLQTGFFTKFVLNTALPPVEELICAKIEVEKLRLSLLPFSLQLEGAVFTDPEEKYDQPFASLERLTVKVKTAPLLVGQVVVSELSIKGAQNYLYIRDGLENLPLCPPKPKEKKKKSDEIFRLKLPIVVEKLHVDARFAMDIPSTTPPATPDNPEPQPSAGLALNVGLIELDGTADLNAGDVQVELRISEVESSFGEMKETIELLAVDVEANLQRWTAQVSRLTIKAPDLELAMTAEAKDLLSDMDLSAHVDLDVDLRKLNQLVLTGPEDMQLAGALHLAADGGLQISKQGLRYNAEGALSMSQATVDRLTVRDFQVAFAMDKEQARLTRLHAAVGDGTIDVSGQLGLHNSMPLQARVQVADLDVGDALVKAGFEDIPAGGVLSTDLTASGQLNKLLLDAAGEVNLAGARFGEALADRLALQVDATVDTTDAETVFKLSAITNLVLENARYGEQARLARAEFKLGSQLTLPAKKDAAPLIKAMGTVVLDQIGVGERIRAERAQLDIEAAGSTAASNVEEMRLVISNVRAGENVLDQVELDAAGLFGSAKNKIERFHLIAGETHLDVSGTADLAQGPLDLDVELRLGDLAQFAGFLGKPLAGSGELKMKVGGTVKEPQAEGSLYLKDIVFDTFGAPSLSAALAYADKRARVDNLLLDTGQTKLKAAVLYDMSGEKPRLEASAHLPETVIHDLLKLAGPVEKLAVDGKLWLDAELAGPLDGLTGKVQVRAAKVLAFKERVESVELNARLQDGEIVLDGLEIVKPRHIRPVFHRGLWRPKPESQIGEDDRLPAVLSITGRVNPQDKTFAVQMRSRRLTETASDTVARERIRVMADLELLAELAGTFDNPGGKLELNVDHGRYEHLDLGNSKILVEVIDKQVRLHGSLLEGRQPVHLDEPAAPATDGEAASSPVEAEADLGAIRFEGSFGWEGRQPISGRIVFDRFDYGNFLKSREQVKRSRRALENRRGEQSDQEEIFVGLIRGEITLDGYLGSESAAPAGEGEVAVVAMPDKPRDLTASARFEEILFQRNEFMIRNQNERGEVKPIEIEYRRGEVDIKQFALGGKGVKIKLDRQNLRGEPYFVLSGQIGLGMAKAFTDILTDAHGVLDLKAEIPVRFDLDKVTASAKIPRANFLIQNVPTAIDAFTMDIRFAKRAATIKQFSAKIGGGTMTAGGSFKLPPKQPENREATGVRRVGDEDDKPRSELNLFFKIENVKTGVDPYLEVAIDKVDVIISSRKDGKLDISGEVNVAKAVVSYDVDLITLFKMFQKPRGSVTGSEVYEKKEENVFFNLVIRAPRNVALDNNFAQIEVKLDLILTGSNVETGMIGTVEVVKGKAEVLQNTYRVTSAVIQFFDETRIYPAFDVNAETDVSDTKIFINVSGTPDRYKISFQSDPPKPERDIVTLLSLGVSYEEFQAGTMGEEAAAVAIAQQLIGSPFRKYIGVDFGVDTSTGTSRFWISRELEKDLGITLYRGISDPTLGAELEYSFIRYMAVYTDWSNFAGQEDVPAIGGFGAGVRIKIDFR